MIEVIDTITVNRPAEEVFSFVADQTNAPRWQQGLDEVRRLTHGPLRVGTEHEFVRRFAGRRVAERNRFVAFEPGRFVAFELPDGWITGRASYLAEPRVDGGTLLTSRMDLRVHGAAAAFEPVLSRLLVHDSRRDAATLKQILEQPGALFADPAKVSAVQRWGWLSGVTGAVANGLLLIMFVQYAAEPDGTSPWVWTGPANDAVGAVAALAGAPMVLALTSLSGPSRSRRALARMSVLGAAGLATSSVLLLLGRTTLEVQTAVSVPYILALFAWLHALGSDVESRHVLTRGQARAAQLLGRLLLGGMAVSGAGLLLPSGTPIRQIALGAGVGLGAAGFLGYPLWQMQVSRRISAATADLRPTAAVEQSGGSAPSTASAGAVPTAHPVTASGAPAAASAPMARPDTDPAAACARRAAS